METVCKGMAQHTLIAEKEAPIVTTGSGGIHLLMK